MNVERADEIIAAYGGDPARWPAEERAAALRLVEADAGLARVRAEASALDADMSSWSQQADVVFDEPGEAHAAAARVLAARPALHPVWRWAAGTGMAVAVAAGVIFANPFAAPHVHPLHSAASDAAAFAMVFTPTPDEDGSI